MGGGNSWRKLQSNHYKGTRIVIESSRQPQLPLQKLLEGGEVTIIQIKEQISSKNTAENSDQGDPCSFLCNQTLSWEA